jgi:cell division protein FtsZ
MAINISVPADQFELKPRITVVGTGGAGGNAVNNMIRSNLEGVEFVVANTDAQALSQSACPNRIQLGVNITRGLGAGSRPEIGRAAAEEVLDEIMEYLHGSNMVFVTAGMGGGTGTGAAPVIARAAREAGILTVGVVTKPFHFEGAHRMRLAESGLDELQQVVDTLIIIPNQNLFRIANEKTTFADAFKLADNVLHSGVRGITDLMVMPGLINLDFADIRTVMMEMGKAMMGTGEAEGENRAVAAAEAAISNPLLDDVSMKGAKGVLINITGGYDMTLFEIDEAANRIREEVDADANIIFGSTFDEALEGRMRLSIVATGIDSEHIQRIPVTARQGDEVPGRIPQGSQHGFGLGALHAARRSSGGGNPYSTTPARTPSKSSGTSSATHNTGSGGGGTVSPSGGAQASVPVTAAASAYRSAASSATGEAAHGHEGAGAGAPIAVAEMVDAVAPQAAASAGMPSRVSSGLSAADLGGGRGGNTFVPPEPARPATEPEPVMLHPGHEPGRAPQAAGHASGSNSGGKPSFFERLTGAPAQRPATAPDAGGARMADARAPEAHEVGAPAAPDNNLDIPAFLRRQGH